MKRRTFLKNVAIGTTALAVPVVVLSGAAPVVYGVDLAQPGADVTTAIFMPSRYGNGHSDHMLDAARYATRGGIRFADIDARRGPTERAPE